MGHSVIKLTRYTQHFRLLLFGHAVQVALALFYFCYYVITQGYYQDCKLNTAVLLDRTCFKKEKV